MALYRVTIRHGRPQQYAMRDVEAATLGEAMRVAAEHMPEAVEPGADLAEIRVQAEPESRSYLGE